MEKVLFLESVAGVAGDMFAASFVDAGLVSIEELQRLPLVLGLAGVSVVASRAQKATMRATHLSVSWEGDGWKHALEAAGHSHGDAAMFKPQSSHTHANVAASDGVAHWHTHYADLDRFLERSPLDAPVKAFARKVFRLLAEAEADAHGMPVAEVAFHEVGAVDSIVDVVMAAFCVSKLGAARVCATPVKLGRGLVKMEHGTHPVPPPASARLMVGAPIAPVPAAITRADVELSTPTGLAILKALGPDWVDGVPAGTVRAQGMGAGTMDLGSYPNVFRVTLVEATGGARVALPYESDRVVEIRCNIDDETPERVAWTVEKLMALGALDAWITPVTGKKGRPGFTLGALCARDNWEALADWLLKNTSTFGLRHREWDRLKLSRRIETRETPQGPVRFKIGSDTNGKFIKEKPEYEDLRKYW
jgi:uncharacterized protein (TIGR00299 family) protein